MPSAEPVAMRLCNHVCICVVSIIPIIVGAVLLVAAMFKIQWLVTDPFPTKSIFTHPWMMGGLIAFELLVGLWLVLGCYARWARRAALAAFAVFLGVALFQATSGESSCACFGKIQASPWIAMLVDSGALAALSVWKPVDTRQSKRHQRVLMSVAVIISCIFLLAFVVGIVARPSYGACVLVPSSARIEMDPVTSGGRGQARFSLKNASTKAVEVADIRSSCPCLTVDLLRRRFVPQEELEAVLSLDLGSAPQFVGNLAIEVHGLTTTGEMAFAIDVGVTVIEDAGTPH